MQNKIKRDTSFYEGENQFLVPWIIENNIQSVP